MYSNTVDKFVWDNDHIDNKMFVENKCVKDEMTAEDFVEELKKIFTNVVES